MDTDPTSDSQKGKTINLDSQEGAEKGYHKRGLELNSSHLLMVAFS